MEKQELLEKVLSLYVWLSDSIQALDVSDLQDSGSAKNSISAASRYSYQSVKDYIEDHFRPLV